MIRRSRPPSHTNSGRTNRYQQPQSPGNSGFDDRGDTRLKNRNFYQQMLDKYSTLARDSLRLGDRIESEVYFQHAEHYLRQLNERVRLDMENQPQQRKSQPNENNDSQGENRQNGRFENRPKNRHFQQNKDWDGQKSLQSENHRNENIVENASQETTSDLKLTKPTDHEQSLFEGVSKVLSNGHDYAKSGNDSQQQDNFQHQKRRNQRTYFKRTSEDNTADKTGDSQNQDQKVNIVSDAEPATLKKTRVYTKRAPKADVKTSTLSDPIA